MRVVSHGHVGLGGQGMEVMVAMHAGQYHEGLVACGEMPEPFPSARWWH